MSADLYPRPSREIIAEIVKSQLPGAISADEARSEPEPQGSALANFSLHLNARMHALGWDQTKLQEKTGIGPHVAARAMNGTGCDIAVAEKIAEMVGGYLATMIGPYMCSTCHGEPPAGFACLECGAETRAA